MLFEMKQVYKNNETGKQSTSLFEILRADEPYDLSSGLLDFPAIEPLAWSSVAPEWCHSLATSKVKQNITRSEFIHRFIETYKAAVFEHWDPEKQNVVFHSSGWDSRLLSWCLMKLRDKGGEGAVGNVHFICYGPECEAFVKIMKSEGWPLSRYICLHEQGPGPLEEELVLEDAWRKLCWPADYPLSLWSVILEELHRSGRLSLRKEAVLWVGQYHNEFLRESLLQKNPLVYMLGKYYGSIYTAQASAVPYEMRFPLWNEKTVELLQTAVVNYYRGSIRQQIAERCGIIGAIQPVIISPITRSLTLKLRARLVKDYMKTEYAKQTGVHFDAMDIPSKLRIDPFWLHWNNASYVKQQLERDK